MGLFDVITVVLCILKIFHLIEISWFQVFIPTMIDFVIYFIKYMNND